MPQGQPSVGYTLPAPHRGLTAMQPIDDMDPACATELVNIVPTGLGAEVRKGYELLAEPVAAAQIGTLQGLALATGGQKLIATTTGKFWEVSTGAAVDTTGGTVPTEKNWNPIQHAHRVYLANGADTVQVYDGSTIADSSFSGVTLANLISGGVFKESIYFIEKDKLKVWRSSANAVGSEALTATDFRSAFRRGGFMTACGGFTNQQGDLTSDLFMGLSSEGELLFYNGEDPGDTDTPWRRVARYEVGKPCGFRACIAVPNDTWILTAQGVVPVSMLFNGTFSAAGAKDDPRLAINPLLAAYAKQIPFSHLWHGCYCPATRRVYICVPTESDQAFLAVYSMEAEGWCFYQLHSAADCVALAVSDENLFFGGTGAVYTAESGYNDNDEAIDFNARLAFSFLGNRGQFKVFKDIRPLMYSRRGIRLQLGVDTNFQRRSSLDEVATSEGMLTPYGSPYGSPYSDDLAYLYERFGLRGQGHSAALRVAGSIKDHQLKFFGFEIGYDTGGRL